MNSGGKQAPSSNSRRYYGWNSISFAVDKPMRVLVSLNDSLGRRIQTVCDEWFEEGRHSIELELNHLPDGMYYYELRSDTMVKIHTVLVGRR